MSSGISFEALLERLEEIGYKEGTEAQLECTTDLLRQAFEELPAEEALRFLRAAHEELDA